MGSDEHVIAARHSIIADAVESSFIVNGRCIAPCERRRGGKGGAKTWPMPASQSPSEQIVEISDCAFCNSSSLE